MKNTSEYTVTDKKRRGPLRSAKAIIVSSIMAHYPLYGTSYLGTGRMALSDASCGQTKQRQPLKTWRTGRGMSQARLGLRPMNDSSSLCADQIVNS